MPSLCLHDSLARRKARFQPLDPWHVRIHVCGLIVCGLVQMGNRRPAVAFDLLMWRSYPRVTCARNITGRRDRIGARGRAGPADR